MADCVNAAQYAILLVVTHAICQQPTLPNTAAAAGGISSLLYRGVTAAAYYSIRSFLNKTIRRGKLTLVCPDGSEFSCGDSNAPPNKQVLTLCSYHMRTLEVILSNSGSEITKLVNRELSIVSDITISWQHYCCSLPTMQCCHYMHKDHFWLLPVLLMLTLLLLLPLSVLQNTPADTASYDAAQY
jgi:hypothetical protein